VATGLQARTILEVGTSYGYSTLWLAAAARATGGKVISLELVLAKVEYARGAVAAAGLEHHVEFRVGDARASLRELRGPFDLVLLDVWKEHYISCFELFRTTLGERACVIADNMLSPASTRHEADAYRAHVRNTGAFDSVLLPLGSGLEISRRRSY
jgi:predicted O-methyltransferase YrrM